MNIQTDILHCDTETSDKVYIIEVNHFPDSKQYVVTATWGKRTAPRLSSQIKYETTQQSAALEHAKKLINDKLRSRDEYKPAKAGLTIPGFKRDAISAAHVHIDSTTVARTHTIVTSDVPLTRKIRL